MPRVNHDASHRRLIEKYGVPLPAYKAKQRSWAAGTSFKKKPKSVAVKPEMSRWLKTQKEFLRWKKTDDYQQWRKAQFAKQDAACYYCDIPLRGVRTNIEHIIPKSKGGTNKKSNLVLACWKCNKDKNTTVLSKKKRKELRSKHISKSKAWAAQQRFLLELSNRF